MKKTLQLILGFCLICLPGCRTQSTVHTQAITSPSGAEVPTAQGKKPYYEGWTEEVFLWVPRREADDAVSHNRWVPFEFPNKGPNAIRWSGMWLNSYRNAQLFYWDGVKWRIVSYQPVQENPTITTVLELDKSFPVLHLGFLAQPEGAGSPHAEQVNVGDLPSAANEDLLPAGMTETPEEPLGDGIPGATDKSLFVPIGNGGNSSVFQTFVATHDNIKTISFRYRSAADWRLRLRIRDRNSLGRVITDTTQWIRRPHLGPATAMVPLADCQVSPRGRYVIELSCLTEIDDNSPVCVGLRYDNPYPKGFCFFLSSGQGDIAPAFSCAGTRDLALSIHYTTGGTTELAKVDFDIKQFEEWLRLHMSIVPSGGMLMPEETQTDRDREPHH